jgi:hypothetical protein
MRLFVDVVAVSAFVFLMLLFAPIFIPLLIWFKDQDK